MTLPSKTALSLLCLCPIAALGCTTDPGSDDAEIVDTLRQAIPSSQDLLITMPAAQADQSGASAAVGDPAVLLAWTSEIATDLNEQISASYDYVESLTLQAPTSYTDTRADWGPWDYPENTLIYRFYAEATTPDLVEFALEARPRTPEDAAFEPILTGSTEREPDTGRYFGSIAFDYDTYASLDPSVDYGGTAWIGYDHRSDPSTVGATFFDDTSPGDPVDLAYNYAYRADGSGSIEYAYSGGADDAGNPYGSFDLATRWDATGAGRSDSNQSDASGTESWSGTECWNSYFGRVYFSDDAEQNPDEGDAADCIFSEAL